MSWVSLQQDFDTIEWGHRRLCTHPRHPFEKRKTFRLIKLYNYCFQLGEREREFNRRNLCSNLAHLFSVHAKRLINSETSGTCTNAEQTFQNISKLLYKINAYLQKSGILRSRSLPLPPWWLFGNFAIFIIDNFFPFASSIIGYWIASVITEITPIDSCVFGWRFQVF